MRAMLQFIAGALVDKPEAVEVNEVEAAEGTLLELRVAQEDLGKVIGKQGRTARALRTLVAAAGAKLGKRCAVEILE